MCQLLHIYEIQLEDPSYQMLFSPVTADTANICERWDHDLSSLETTDGTEHTEWSGRSLVTIVTVGIEEETE